MVTVPHFKNSKAEDRSWELEVSFSFDFYFQVSEPHLP